MKFTFGDIVVVEETQIGVVVKTWVRNNEELIYEVYVRNLNNIKEYKEKDIQRYMVRHKELNEEEIEYQNNAINPFVSREEIERYTKLIRGILDENNIK